MSVKAMTLVWDLKCPQLINGIQFRPSHKFTLLAYADHADHLGKNIWPAVPTIARKTGFEDRSVQRLTNDLESMGLLIEDGKGPKGTNKWALPFSDKGDCLSPRQSVTGDIDDESLGDSALGDISSGDSVSPELKEPEPDKEINKDMNQKIWDRVLQALPRDPRNAAFVARIRQAQFSCYDGNTLTVRATDRETCEWLEDRAGRTIEQLLLGIVGKPVSVSFSVEVTEAVR